MTSKSATRVVARYAAVALLCQAGLALANTDAVQSLTSISQSVEQFIGAAHGHDASLTVNVNALDQRLRLPRCNDTLQSSWSPGSRDTGHVTVRVRCQGSRPWQVHVQAEVTRETRVWTLKRAVRRGDVLDSSMVRAESVTLGRDLAIASRSGEPVVNLDAWQGFAFAQAVQPGQLLTQRQLVPQTLVERGEKVRIRHRRAGLHVESTGIALGAGARDQRIQVRNPSSSKVIEAIVIGRGIVIPGFQ